MIEQIDWSKSNIFSLALILVNMARLSEEDYLSAPASKANKLQVVIDDLKYSEDFKVLLREMLGLEPA